MPQETDCDVELTVEPIYYDEQSKSAAFAIAVNGEVVSSILVSEDAENVQRK